MATSLSIGPGVGVRYRLDQTVIPPRLNYAYSFDHAVVSQDGKYVALVERLGTKGLLLRRGEVIREINRSFYHANVYEYPITFLMLPDGRTALAHCPESYCKIEIEEVESGQNLSPRDVPPKDFFHSRLTVGPDSRYLASVGWIWHPFNDLWVYELKPALAQPTLLDEDPRDEYKFARTGVGVNAAAFLENGRLVLTTNDEYYDSEDVEEAERHLMGPESIGVYDLTAKRFISQSRLQEVAGTLMPVGSHALGFYQHPKLIELSTGQVVARWTELWSGEQNGSILHGGERLPPLAFDVKNKRFAVASEEEIVVIQFG